MLACGCAVALVAVCVVAFVSNGQPGVRRYWPSVTTALIVVGVLVLVWRFVTGSYFAGIVAVSASVLVGVVLAVAVIPDWSIEHGIRAAEPGLTHTMQQLMATSDGCGPPPRGATHIEPVGDVDEVCVLRGTDVSFDPAVIFTAGPSSSPGLLYWAPEETPLNRPPGPDECVRHVFGPWWEIVHWDSDAEAPTPRCPIGFEAAGG